MFSFVMYTCHTSTVKYVLTYEVHHIIIATIHDVTKINRVFLQLLKTFIFEMFYSTHNVLMFVLIGDK